MTLGRHLPQLTVVSVFVVAPVSAIAAGLLQLVVSLRLPLP